MSIIHTIVSFELCVYMCMQTALTGTEGEKDRLVEQVQSLASVTRERDSLTQQLSTAQQQLQEAQVCVWGE